jgi:hypothetical protein
VSYVAARLIKDVTEALAFIAKEVPRGLAAGHRSVETEINRAADAFDAAENKLALAAKDLDKTKGKGHHGTHETGSGLSGAGTTTGAVRPHRFGKLLANHSYIHNGATYLTDEHGRVIKVSVPKMTRNKATRDVVEQRRVGKAGQPGDHGGHLIGARFGGSRHGYNLVPQNANLNLGIWKKMENKWDNALKDGKDVSVDIHPVYTDATHRPSSFDVSYSVDGIRYRLKFHNKPTIKDK